MKHTLTLVSGPAGGLDDTVVERVRENLHGAGSPTWLSPKEACDIPFEPAAKENLEQVRDFAKGMVGGAPVDVFVQPEQDRRKSLLVADMDSTLIGQECIDELADFVGLKPKVAAITERAMRGEIQFESALRERVALLEGLDESVLARVFDERITLTPGARVLVQTMRASGATTVIVSGGFTFFTARVAERAGFDVHHGNTLEISGGKLTGRVLEPIQGQQAKLDALQSHRETLSLRPTQTLGVGDGANDLAMLEEAGLGVAYYAKPIVAEKAHAQVNYGDLTALLFAQGYRRDEFSDQ